MKNEGGATFFLSPKHILIWNFKLIIPNICFISQGFMGFKVSYLFVDIKQMQPESGKVWE